MRLKKLQLENFRNHRSLQLDFDATAPVTVIIGPNGRGKTNILEALALLSISRSFKTGHFQDLIYWEEEYLRCSCQCEMDSESFNLEFFYSDLPPKKVFKLNDVSTKRQDFIGNLLTVVFHPEDLNILYLSPSLRRKFLDVVLSQTDKNYLFDLLNFNKVLHQRNSLLKLIQSERHNQKLAADLDIWDLQLVKFGSEIITKRQDFIDFLNSEINRHYLSISGKDEEVRLEYCTNAGDFLTALTSNRARDIMIGLTQIGPHRDDFASFINGHSIYSASRGEFRTLLLAIKMAEIGYIKTKNYENPLVLLDDVFSELDPERQKQLLSAVTDCQTIITATDINSLDLTKIGSISKVVEL